MMQWHLKTPNGHGRLDDAFVEPPTAAHSPPNITSQQLERDSGRQHPSKTVEPSAGTHHHVRWGASAQSPHEHGHEWDAAEQAHHTALGMGRRGSFHPLHASAHELQAAAEPHSGCHRHPVCVSHGKQQRGPDSKHGSRSSSNPRNGRHGDKGPEILGSLVTVDAASPVGDDIAGSASEHISYQPHSLKDYWEHGFDPKLRPYWVLGKLEREFNMAELQVGT